MIDGAGGGEGGADEGSQENAGVALFKEFACGPAGGGGADHQGNCGGDDPDESADGEGEEELGEGPAFHGCDVA